MSIKRFTQALERDSNYIPALASHFLNRFATQMDKHIAAISREAMEILVSYDWPGNVRELSNAIERAMVVGKPPAIQPEDLPLRGWLRAASPVGESLAEVEKLLIRQTLTHVTSNREEAARALGISRRALQYKLKEYRLLEGEGESEVID